MSWFWSPDVWLPPSVTWEDLKSDENTKYPEFGHLYHLLPLAVVFLVARFLIEHMIWSPVGRWMGLKNAQPKTVIYNEVLEQTYRRHRQVSHRQVRHLSGQLQWSAQKVDRWLRLRKLRDSPNKLTRFTETGWQCTYYTAIFFYGLYTLWDKQWFWEIRLCFHRLPFHAVDADVWWYYMLSLGFYWSMTLHHFYDFRRRDFWPMLVHHGLTICLLTFSWAANFVRIGTLTLIVHDVADIFLLAAKMFRYVDQPGRCHVAFGVFVPVWLTTRLVVFPGWIICGLYRLNDPPGIWLMPHGLPIVSAPDTIAAAVQGAAFAAPKPFPAYYLFIGMLVGLLALHCFWTYLMVMMLVDTLRHGQIRGDTRSESSEEVSSSSSSEEASQHPRAAAADKQSPLVTPATGRYGGAIEPATAAGGDCWERRAAAAAEM